jgi:hypothetical protein
MTFVTSLSERVPSERVTDSVDPQAKVSCKVHRGLASRNEVINGHSPVIRLMTCDSNVEALCLYACM